MKSVKLLVAKTILRIVCWYFVGREVTRVHIDDYGTRHQLQGKVAGRRIEFPEGVLVWMPAGGYAWDAIELSLRDLRAVNGSWEFYD